MDYLSVSFPLKQLLKAHILHSLRFLSSAMSYSERVQSIHFIFSESYLIVTRYAWPLSSSISLPSKLANQ